MTGKIVLVLNYPADGQESMLRFGDTLEALLSGCGTKVIAWTPPYLFGRLSAWLPRGSFKWLAYLDKFGLGALSLLYVRLCSPKAIWHVVDHGNALYAFLLPAGRVVVTCHDAIAIEDAISGRTGQKVGRFGLVFQRAIAAGLRRAASIVCVSRATADDLLRLIDPEPSRIRVVYNGFVQKLALPSGPDEAKRLLSACGIDSERPFLLMVGSDLVRKNRLNAIHCFNLLRADDSLPQFRLVMVGKPMAGQNRAAAEASPWRSDIVEVGKVDGPTLAAAYQQASVVLFPSLAEGFGLPIIEAQLCDGALVTSRRQPMQEIAGDGAVLVDPENPADIAAGVKAALREDGNLRRRGRQNVERFSPETMLEGYLQAYRALGYDS